MVTKTLILLAVFAGTQAQDDAALLQITQMKKSKMTQKQFNERLIHLSQKQVSEMTAEELEEWQWFKDNLKKAGDWASGVVNHVKDKSEEAAKKIKDDWDKFTDDVKQAAEDVGEKIEDWKDDVSDFVGDAVEKVKDVAQDVVEFVPGLETAIECAGDIGVEVKDAVAATGKKLADATVKLKKKADVWFEKAIDKAACKAARMHAKFKAFKEECDAAFAATVEAVQETAESLRAKAKAAAIAAGEKFHEVKAEMGAKFDAFVDSFVEFCEDTGETLKEIKDDAAEAIVDAANAAARIPGFVAGAAMGAVDVVVDTAGHVVEALKAAHAELKQKAEDALEAAFDTAKCAAARTAKWAKEFKQDIEDAIEKSIDFVRDGAEAFQAKVEAAIDAAGERYGEFKITIGAKWNDYRAAVSAALCAAGQTIQAMKAKATDALQTAKSSVVGWVRDAKAWVRVTGKKVKNGLLRLKKRADRAIEKGLEKAACLKARAHAKFAAFREDLDEAFAAAIDAVQETAETLKAKAKEVARKTLEKYREIKAEMADHYDAFVEAFAEFCEDAGETLKEAQEDAAVALQQAAETLVTLPGAAIGVVAGAADKAITLAQEGVQALKAAHAELKKSVESAIEAALDKASCMRARAAARWKSFKAAFYATIDRAMDAVRDGAVEFQYKVETAIDVALAKFDDIKDAIGDKVAEFKAAFSSGLCAAGRTIKAVKAKISEGLQCAKNSMDQWIAVQKDAFNDAREAVAGEDKCATEDAVGADVECWWARDPKINHALLQIKS